MINKLIFFISILFLTACIADKKQSKYLRSVGDIKADSSLDDPDFKLCNDEMFVKQYFNFSQGVPYEGEMLEIMEVFKAKYNPIATDESGWIRVRFIVNCAGKSGRFRVISSDEEYNEMEFDARIADQVLAITKSLDGWKILPNQENPEEYYQYLVFKIKKGNLIEIMP